ncbi:unnamed protein product [Periconia digitata]|uniref:Uncharacterized protein n=1 Tax=Periconia digitata TaxID=1303443 RepID=A0A9W4UUW4_9PLEO|nr:unnamed protein product [Periconia digitata]
MAPFIRLILLLATILELALAVVLVVLFTCAHKYDYNMVLWTAGGARGWNSDPALRVYDYANYRQPPPIPAIWDQSTPTTNFYIAGFTTLLWVIRLKINLSNSRGLDLCTVLTTNVLYDMLMIALWTSSISLQRAADFSDHEHLSVTPWYLAHECEEAARDAYTACRMAKASYQLSLFTAIWFGLRLMSTCIYAAFLYGMQMGSKEFGKGVFT